MKYYLGHFIIDVGHLEYELEHPLIPKWQPYNNFFFKGNHSRNGWFAFDGTLKNVNIFGEVATDYNSRPALWGGLLYGIEGHTDLTVSYRNISKAMSALSNGNFSLSTGISLKPNFLYKCTACSHFRFDTIIIFSN